MSRSRPQIPILLVLVLIAGLFLLFWKRHQWFALPGSNERGKIEREPAESLNGPFPLELEVHFSNTYANNPLIGEQDPGNIDRHLSALIDSANVTIDCALFELESSRITGHLLAAHRRGVRVRMVLEEDYAGNPDVALLRSAGVPIVEDGRSGYMHNKFFIIDGYVVWTGSFNATDNGAWRNNNNAVVIRSRDVAENYVTEFREMFERSEFGPRSTSDNPHSLVKLPNADIYTYFSPEDDLPPKVIRYIRLAKQRIRFMAFSMTDDNIGNALIDQYRSGVDVSGILETRGSSMSSSELGKFREAGLPVLLDANRYVMHHKVMIIDDTWTIVGSYNFSANAAERNDENLLIIKSPAVAKAFTDEFVRVERIAPAQ